MTPEYRASIIAVAYHPFAHDLERRVADAIRDAENDALERAALLFGEHSEIVAPAIRALKHPVE